MHVGVFWMERSLALLDSAAVDWKGRSAYRLAALAGAPEATRFDYGK